MVYYNVLSRELPNVEAAFMKKVGGYVMTSSTSATDHLYGGLISYPVLLCIIGW